MHPTEVKKHVIDMEIWNNAVWVNHNEKIFFVPIWRNGNTTFMNNVAEQYSFTLEKNINLTNYTGFTVIRDPRKRLIGQIWRACVNNNYSLEYVMNNLKNGVVIDIHLDSQHSFLKSYNIHYYLDLDNLTYVDNSFINKIIDVYLNSNLIKHNITSSEYATKIQSYLQDNLDMIDIIDKFYTIDYELYKKVRKNDH
jgi:hypothetical protein